MLNLSSGATAVPRAAVAVALAVGVAASMPACTTAAPTAGEPTASPVPSAPASGTVDTPSPTGSKPTTESPPASPGAAGDADPIMRGERQVVLRPIGSFESILAVDAKGRLNLTDGDTDKSLFVLLPARDNRYQIRTAQAHGGGEPDCMGLRDNGSSPATVVATACDAGRAGQLFAIEKTREKSEGRPTYTISGEGRVYLRATDRQGLVAQRVGEGDAGEGLAFDLVDNGAAPAGPGG
ncbi:hypothetical protein KBX06_26135 [Micromonospora sp. C31]|uniref:hypothetical protein n=1 Tax=Micromonospora sp. C31 TaxID=2824876 RepID=UPI001B386746|nr:hypothetical protein [Micromonospora sp. C31]MBQ1076606.1 hypothetical protein [Micromonospora sp. C31]